MARNNHSGNFEQSPSTCCMTSDSSPKKIAHPFMKEDGVRKNSQVSFFVKGMTCMSCARKIEAILSECSGVDDVAVDLAEQKATISYDPAKTRLDDLKTAVGTAGYKVIENKSGSMEETSSRQRRLSKQAFRPHPSVIGVAAALGVVGFYLGLLTVTSDWNNARAQFAEYRWWIIALALGLGIQGTLYTYLKKQLKGRTIKAAKSSLAASGGVSTASMAACCAHYLVAFLPALGLPFLSAAAAGLVEYQVEFFFLGVISNLVGIVVMLRTMNKNGLIPAGALARSLTIGL